jgi:malto-oligosyltrehalose synthase/4-alpha-glucanotransferase
MFDPVSTYRIQFSKEFTFTDLERIIPYLHDLGIRTIYASPVFTAVAGSTHGYDGTDPLRINPEIGTDEQLREISSRLKTYGISWIQDIVPNHMAFHHTNTWLMDVLEKGRASEYADYFDIVWDAPLYNGRLMVPFLGGTVTRAISDGDLQLCWTSEKFMLQCGDLLFPLSARSAAMVQSLNAAPRTCVQMINESPMLLEQIVHEQHYILCSWKETSTQINYRRFFTVNGLICLNMQHEHVFDAYHRYILGLVSDGIFQGLRIDHVDGLSDPAGYLERLRHKAGSELYITVEKILQHNEYLPDNWPVQGNTGYDFLGMVNNLLTDPSAERAFTGLYNSIVGDQQEPSMQALHKKALILYEHMGGELDNLYRLFKTLFPQQAATVRGQDLKDAIGAVLIHCPVYRYYGNRFPLHADEQEQLAQLFRKLHTKAAPGTLYTTATDVDTALQILEQLFLHPDLHNPAALQHTAQFYSRLMQFSGPLTAKGVEDTLMYTYNRFIGHNEVGDSPEIFGQTPGAFHEQMINRRQQWRLSGNTTSTHDTKRGEDARARLNVLTEIPELFRKQVLEWQKLNKGLKHNDAPASNDEYLIYQALLAAYDPLQETELEKRFSAYLQKAMREAKVYSDWSEPDEQYEGATTRFASALLDRQSDFYNSFISFYSRIADGGMMNALSQLLLKFTCPGIPDVYQGTELWDFSLVDPDNRRKVDYDKRMMMLQPKPGQSALTIQELWNTRADGQIKLKLTQLLLHVRTQYSSLFADGFYIPLEVTGAHHEHIFAFARRKELTWIITAIPLHPTALADKQKKAITHIDWADTGIIIPADLPGKWENLVTNTTGIHNGSIAVAELFAGFPLALIRLEFTEKKRSAGVLMHITSLPSRFGIGDFGPEAKRFAGILADCNQRYWQILPLNPTNQAGHYSPYSSGSCMAGNTMLISPELLAGEGLLDKEMLSLYTVTPTEEADFTEAARIRSILLPKAYEAFKERNDPVEQELYTTFCTTEAAWLDDFACYILLKEAHNGLPWNEWFHPYKSRNAKALKMFTKEHREKLDEIRWQQYIFFKQWNAFKRHCTMLGIRLFGDIPFYVSFDSADVWAHPDIFSLDVNGNVSGIAGVPPDYFSEDGQLWHMPTFRWDVLHERGYDWWIERLRKNTSLFDLLRLDHFRAFESYWEVPAGETTARNGEWKPGPRHEFFKAAQQSLGTLPFVAEDLGGEMEKVYTFRNELNLPGMKVLQFAFGENIGTAIDIPHNFDTHNCIVYTGTHDNNTANGWYEEELKPEDRSRLDAYTGIFTESSTVHDVICRMAHASIADIAILPMQDILGLGKQSRMNTPGAYTHNWFWRVLPKQVDDNTTAKLRSWTRLYGRI